MVPPFQYTHEHVPQIILKLSKRPVPKKPRICRLACQGSQTGKCTNPKPPPNGHGFIELDTTLWALDPDFSNYGVRQDGMEIAFYGEPGSQFLKHVTIGYLQIHGLVYDKYDTCLIEAVYQGLGKVVYFFKDKPRIASLLEECQRVAKAGGLFTDRYETAFNEVVANKKAFADKKAREAAEAAAEAAAAAAPAVSTAVVDRLANLQAEGHQQLTQAITEQGQQTNTAITNLATSTSEQIAGICTKFNQQNDANNTRFTNIEEANEATNTEVANLKKQLATLAMGGNVAPTGTAPPQIVLDESDTALVPPSREEIKKATAKLDTVAVRFEQWKSAEHSMPPKAWKFEGNNILEALDGLSGLKISQMDELNEKKKAMVDFIYQHAPVEDNEDIGETQRVSRVGDGAY